MKKALDFQVGGSHYKNSSYQPIQFSRDLNLNGFQLSMVKYLTRYKSKNGREDLEKLKHYAQLGCELRPLNFIERSSAHEICINYATENCFDLLRFRILHEIVYQQWGSIISDTENLIKREYGTVQDSN